VKTGSKPFFKKWMGHKHGKIRRLFELPAKVVLRFPCLSPAPSPGVPPSRGRFHGCLVGSRETNC